MKKFTIFIFSFFVMAGVLAIISVYNVANNIPSIKRQPKVLPAKTESKDPYATLKTISYEGKSYTYDYIIVDDSANITLIPNYDQKYTSDEVKESYDCNYLVNAGFYTKENTPIGLVISDYEQVGEKKKSSLFNGYFSINPFDTPLITEEPQEIPPRIALQSGPLLIINSYKTNLSIKNDKNSRRSVAAVDGSNRTLFMVFFDPNSVFSGPKLGDLPTILKSVSDAIGMNIADAINLDGGSASAFVGNGLTLKELTHVGSFFCVR